MGAAGPRTLLCSEAARKFRRVVRIYKESDRKMNVCRLCCIWFLRLLHNLCCCRSSVEGLVSKCHCKYFTALPSWNQEAAARAHEGRVWTARQEQKESTARMLDNSIGKKEIKEITQRFLWGQKHREVPFFHFQSAKQRTFSFIKASSILSLMDVIMIKETTPHKRASVWDRVRPCERNICLSVACATSCYAKSLSRE